MLQINLFCFLLFFFLGIFFIFIEIILFILLHYYNNEIDSDSVCLFIFDLKKKKNFSVINSYIYSLEISHIILLL